MTRCAPWSATAHENGLRQDGILLLLLLLRGDLATRRPMRTGKPCMHDKLASAIVPAPEAEAKGGV